jgi:hypothetical protein
LTGTTRWRERKFGTAYSSDVTTPSVSTKVAVDAVSFAPSWSMARSLPSFVAPSFSVCRVAGRPP